MRNVLYSGFILLVMAGVAVGEEPGRLVRETWDAAYLGSVKSGFVHTIVREIPSNGGTVIRTTTELTLSVKKQKDTVALRMETGTDETKDGNVTALSMRQFLDRRQQLEMVGNVSGDGFRVKVDGGRRLDKTIAWNDAVLGLYQQSQIFRGRRVKPGDRFSYRSFEPTVTAVVTFQVTVREFEEIASPVDSRRQRLLRVEAVPDKLGNVQLPKQVFWLDDELEMVQSEVEMPPLGVLKLTRTSREIATSRATAVGVDIGIGQTLSANRNIPRPYDANSAVFRITVKGDDDAASSFARDDGQEVKNAHGDKFELHTRARRQPTKALAPAPPSREYLESCYFIRSDDANVREVARQAVGAESDAWQRALRIERWVHQKMKPVSTTGTVSTADQTARDLEGDCTEFSFLTAAMCRVVGVPSRTAVGLIYHLGKNGPAFGYHMWVEVYVDGEWLPLEPTFGRASVGAMHLKISDHSWKDTQSLTPLFPLMRVMGKLSVEIVSVNGKP